MAQDLYRRFVGPLLQRDDGADADVDGDADDDDVDDVDE